MPLLLNLFPNIFLTVRGVTSVVLFLNTSILLLMFLSVCPYIHAFIFVLNCFLIRKKKQKAHLVRHIIPYDICVTSWWWNFELKGHLDQAHTVSLTFSLTEWNFLMTCLFPLLLPAQRTILYSVFAAQGDDFELPGVNYKLL